MRIATQILVFCELLQIVHHEVAAVIWGERVCGSKAISIYLVQPFKRLKVFSGQIGAHGAVRFGFRQCIRAGSLLSAKLVRAASCRPRSDP